MCDSQAKTQYRPIAEIVREKTNDGELIVQFLVDMVLGKIEGASLWHRLEATRQLERLGLEIPNVVKQAVSTPANGRKPERAPGKPQPEDELADIIKEKTDGGRDIVQFLIEAMQGKLEDFKPRHRLAASDRLITRGFDNAPGHTVAGDSDDERQEIIPGFIDRSEFVDPRTPEQRDPDSPDYMEPNLLLHHRDDDPFDFENYDKEQYYLDNDGERASRHIYGGREAGNHANRAVGQHRMDTYGDESIIRDRECTPIENPEDDPYGKGHYGYKALYCKYGDNLAVRIASNAAAEYHKRKFNHLLNEDGSLNDLADTSSLDPQTLQYLERNRHLLAQKDQHPEYPVGEGFKPYRAYGHCRDCSDEEDFKPSHDPEKHSDEYDSERPRDTPVGEGFKPSRDPEKPPAPKPPPKKIRRIIHLGPPSEDDPPDEDSRRYRDPDEIRVPLRDLLSISAGPP